MSPSRTICAASSLSPRGTCFLRKMFELIVLESQPFLEECHLERALPEQALEVSHLQLQVGDGVAFRDGGQILVDEVAIDAPPVEKDVRRDPVAARDLHH